METTITRLLKTVPRSRCRSAYCLQVRRGSTSTSSSDNWRKPPAWTNVAEDEIARLAAVKRRPLTLRDLLK